MISMTSSCRIVEVAEEFATEIESLEIPTDFDPGDLWFSQVLAQIRHEYTNYDEMLRALEEICFEFQEEHGYGFCLSVESREGEPCPLRQQAYYSIHWEAKRAAMTAYNEWRHRKRRT